MSNKIFRKISLLISGLLIKYLKLLLSQYEKFVKFNQILHFFSKQKINFKKLKQKLKQKLKIKLNEFCKSNFFALECQITFFNVNDL